MRIVNEPTVCTNSTCNDPATEAMGMPGAGKLLVGQYCHTHARECEEFGCVKVVLLLSPEPYR